MTDGMKKLILLFCLAAVLFPANRGNCEGTMRRGLFVTVLQKPEVLSSRKEISDIVDIAKKARVEILFVQVYRANQAWFPSKVADQQPFEKNFKSVGEDSFALLIREAHREGIEVHAWINLLSLSTNKDAKLLTKYGPEILTKNLKDKARLEDYKIDDQFFLEPGDPRVRRELCDMVAEILKTYPELDGLQFDYIRYPDTNPTYGYTKMNVERFKKSTGRLVVEEKSDAWKDWKRRQVTELLQQLVRKARSIRPGIHISSTGCAPYARAYHEAFQNWPSWLDMGLVEFVTLMNYSASVPEFARYIKEVKNNVADLSKVYMAIGAYEMAGKPEVFIEELRIARESGSGGWVIFHYGSLVDSPELKDSLVKGVEPLRSEDKI
jgi:uncharacterized lipoprotein YddW (UPF0748 family)